MLGQLSYVYIAYFLNLKGREGGRRGSWKSGWEACVGRVWGVRGACVGRARGVRGRARGVCGACCVGSA